MWAGTSSSNPTSPTSPTTPAASKPTYRLKNQGRRVAQIVKLKPEFVEKYKECHAKVWPEVLKQIKDSNIEDYSIFHDPETHILFASFKYVGYNWAGDSKEPFSKTLKLFFDFSLLFFPWRSRILPLQCFPDKVLTAFQWSV